MEGFNKTWGNFTIVAPKIIGVDIKNEKRVAASLVNPISNPDAIVIPERDTPGIIASAWDRPIMMPALSVRLYISIFLEPFLSAQYKKMPMVISMHAISGGDLKIVSAFFSKKKPTKAAV